MPLLLATISTEEVAHGACHDSSGPNGVIARQWRISRLLLVSLMPLCSSVMGDLNRARGVLYVWSFLSKSLAFRWLFENLPASTASLFSSFVPSLSRMLILRFRSCVYTLLGLFERWMSLILFSFALSVWWSCASLFFALRLWWSFVHILFTLFLLLSACDIVMQWGCDENTN